MNPATAALAVGAGVTLGSFLVARRLHLALGMHPVANPVLVAAGALAVLGAALEVLADAYAPTAALFGWFLGPHVVLLAVPLYRFRGEIAGAAGVVLPAVVFQFLFGAGLGLVYDRPWLRRRGAMLLAVGAVALLATLVDPWHALEHRWFFWGIPALLLVAGAVTVPQLRHRGLHFLDDASYSLYLIQVFTISAYYKFAVALPVDLPNDVDAVLCMAFTIVAGIGT